MDAKLWSQQEAATALGIKQQTVGVFLSGGNGTSMDVARRVAGLLGEPVESIVGRPEAPFTGTARSVTALPVVPADTRDQRIEVINENFERAFRGGHGSLADLDVARGIVAPLLLNRTVTDLESMGLEAMAVVWLEIVAYRRRTGAITTTLTLLTTLTEYVVAGIGVELPPWASTHSS